jgi:hypothetical protein
MSNQATELPPYGKIISDLIASTMRAQAELITTKGEVSHKRINRHFAWLVFEYPVGINRHFYDGLHRNHPLRTKWLRAKKRLPYELTLIFKNRLPLPVDATTEDPTLVKLIDSLKLVQDEPTRISSMIKMSYLDEGISLYENTESEDDGEDRDGDVEDEDGSESSRLKGISIRSPLSIVYDFLTAPEMPGTRAYALVSLRNYLFETFGVFPDGLADLPKNTTFAWKDVEDAMSHVWTSLRLRYSSSGEDKVPAEGRIPAEGLVRHFLALKGVLWLYFGDLRGGPLGTESCVQYLRAGKLRADVYRFTRSRHLERFPDQSEVVNELWGLPIPIRGGDTIFRGGLKFSRRRGLVTAIHGGPGTGKTTLALALGAFLAPFGIQTLFITADELADDLQIRADGLVPDELRRMSFFHRKLKDWLFIGHLELSEEGGVAKFVEDEFKKLGLELGEGPQATVPTRTPKVCRVIVVLDGLHDLLAGNSITNAADTAKQSELFRLKKFIERCRELQALVIVTAGENWEGNVALDYLVDVALRLTQESMDKYDQKPDRRLLLAKARHQLCATGTHGIQIAGAKGVRFSPQINYQLDRRTIWKTRIPEMDAIKTVLRRAIPQSELRKIPVPGSAGHWPKSCDFYHSHATVDLPRGSNIFLNGRGSGGKAALALKMAIAPVFSREDRLLEYHEKVLVVSFLYPEEYYIYIRNRLTRIRRLEYEGRQIGARPAMKVIHLYPGYLKPNDLFNRIEWELDGAELHGRPYTSVVIDGIHNIFLQFPDIERYSILWPQLYASLRTRPITLITTHTTFALPHDTIDFEVRLDDKRSEPLRHALVQKTDFRIEVDPISYEDVEDVGEPKLRLAEPNTFEVRIISAINQPIPDPERPILWSRERLVLFEKDGNRYRRDANKKNRLDEDQQTSFPFNRDPRVSG